MRIDETRPAKAGPSGGTRFRASSFPAGFCAIVQPFVLAAIALGGPTLARAEEHLIVHEWATFTVLQDESGKAIGGINIDDVPVPETLHKIVPGSLLPVGEGGETNEENTRGHAQVTMRLEKAVINFCPSASVASASAEVGSWNGWLTQFYPTAKVKSPGFTRDHIGAVGGLEEHVPVVVGCIEIVTPEQRALLATIAAGGDERTLSGRPPKPEALSEERWQQLHEMYGWLGQFRNALLIDEQRRRPSAIIEALIKRFHLEGYTPEYEWVSRVKRTR